MFFLDVLQEQLLICILSHLSDHLYIVTDCVPRFKPLHIYIHNTYHMVAPITNSPIFSLTSLPPEIKAMFTSNKPQLISYPLSFVSLFSSCLFQNHCIEYLYFLNCLSSVDILFCFKLSWSPWAYYLALLSLWRWSKSRGVSRSPAALLWMFNMPVSWSVILEQNKWGALCCSPNIVTIALKLYASQYITESQYYELFQHPFVVIQPFNIMQYRYWFFTLYLKGKWWNIYYSNLCQLCMHLNQ